MTDCRERRTFRIMLFGRWIKSPEFIYNWCNRNLPKVKKWGVSRIKVDIPDEPVKEEEE